MQKSDAKLSSDQVNTILDAIIPLIVNKNDEGVFRFLIHKKLENSSPAECANFIRKLLK